MARVYKSSYPRVVVPKDESIWQFLLRSNVDDTPPEKVLLQESENPDKTLTRGDASRLAALGAAALQDVLGLKPQDTIMIIGFNSLDWVMLAHSALWAGIVPACANALASPHEIEHYISLTQPKVIFCDPGETTDKVVKALNLLPPNYTRPTMASIGPRGPGALTFPDDFIRKTKRSQDTPYDLSKGDNHKFPAIICFSSGTSGKPKAVLLSHHNLMATLLSTRAGTPEMFNGQQREVFYAPLCHIYGIVTALIAPLFVGNHVTLLRNYSFQEYIKACSKTRATLLRVLPPTATAMAKDPWVAQQDLTSVHAMSCAGAVLAPDVISRLEQLMNGVSITQGYGMSECAMASLKPYSSKRKPGSVGKLHSGVEMRIVDDNLEDVPEGQPGEILTQSASVFMGYKNNPEATAEAFPFGNGWMRTGDVGRMDSDGYLYLTDRKKDLIKYKGHQVPPAELEGALLSHPLVTEAGVCATWDDQIGTEVPVGYVNLKPEVGAQDRDRVLAYVKTYFNGRVAPFKKLRGGLFYLPTFPRNSTGKLLRRELPARKEEDARKSTLLAKRSAKL